jgi:hypothetical protein
MITLMIAAMAAQALTDGRDSGVDFVATDNRPALSQCMRDKLDNTFKVKAYPEATQEAFEMSPKMAFMGEKPIFRFVLADAADGTRVTMSYRHPLSQKSARQITRKMVRDCMPLLDADTVAGKL